MQLTEPAARRIILIGIIELVLCLISTICGGVMVDTLKNDRPVAIEMGLWALYYLLPAALCILSGVKRSPTAMAFALAANLFGILVCAAGVTASSIYWIYLSGGGYCDARIGCWCTGRVMDEYFTVLTCSELDTLRNCNYAILTAFFVLFIVSFVGSIFGCRGTCCQPRPPPTVIIAGAVPGQTSAVLYTSQTTQHSSPGYIVQQGYPTSVPQQQNYPAEATKQMY